MVLTREAGVFPLRVDLPVKLQLRYNSRGMQLHERMRVNRPLNDLVQSFGCVEDRPTGDRHITVVPQEVAQVESQIGDAPPHR